MITCHDCCRDFAEEQAFWVNGLAGPRSDDGETLVISTVMSTKRFDGAEPYCPECFALFSATAPAETENGATSLS
jgi:hypothetical protein